MKKVQLISNPVCTSVCEHDLTIFTAIDDDFDDFNSVMNSISYTRQSNLLRHLLSK